MEAKTSRSFALPVDDGAIARAFADLSEKMSRLMSAISQAGTAMTRPTERSASHRSVERAEASDVVRSSEKPTVEPIRESAAAIQSSIVEKAAEISTPETAKNVSTRIFVEDAASSEVTPADAVTDAAAEQARVGNASQDLALAEDEALLASLDPETAGVIRVKRRLTGGRKHVKELLEEYQSTHGKPADAPRKKSWWKGNR